MSKVIATLLIVAGTLALIYGGFTYTKETHKADLGPLHMEVQDKERVNVPVWAGVAGIIVGAGILLAGRKI